MLDVPYFRQEKWYNCGPACLRMALSYLGINKSEEEVADLCEADLAGVTCDQIADAAERLGLCSEVSLNTLIV